MTSEERRIMIASWNVDAEEKDQAEKKVEEEVKVEEKEEVKTEEVKEAEEFLNEILEETDSSLIDEWKKLNDPDYDPEKVREEKLAAKRDVPLTRRKAEFSTLVHRNVLSFLKNFKEENWSECFSLIQPTAGNGAEWKREHLEDAIDDYLDDFPPFRMDPEARNKKHHHLTEETTEDGTRLLHIRQTICDPDLEFLWSAYFIINLALTDESGDLHLTFNGIGKWGYPTKGNEVLIFDANS